MSNPSNENPAKNDQNTTAANTRDLKRLKVATRVLFALFVIGVGVIVWMKVRG